MQDHRDIKFVCISGPGGGVSRGKNMSIMTGETAKWFTVVMAGV